MVEELLNASKKKQDKKICWYIDLLVDEQLQDNWVGVEGIRVNFNSWLKSFLALEEARPASGNGAGRRLPIIKKNCENSKKCD